MSVYNKYLFCIIFVVHVVICTKLPELVNCIGTRRRISYILDLFLHLTIILFIKKVFEIN